VTAVLLCLAVAGCGGHDTPATKAPSARPTSLAQLNPSTMRVVRVAFCDLVPQVAVAKALVAKPTKLSTWRDGGRVPGTAGVGHEFGCAWSGPHARTARAWVFARPVTAVFARTVIRSAEEDAGCRVATARGFGSPSVVQTCVRTGTAPRVRRAGLFGGTWLTCEVSGHDRLARLQARATAWCVSVASALDAGRAAS